MILEIEVSFIGGRFHGEEWEWPPSPTRLFQALIAASHHGVHGLFHVEQRDAALLWLEQLPPPTIIAGSTAYGAHHVENYVPNNDDALGTNAHVRTAKSLSAHVVPDGGAVTYRWAFDPTTTADRHADVVAAMASLVTWLGRATDSVHAAGRVLPAPSETAGRRTFSPIEAPRGKWRSPSAGFYTLCKGRFPNSVSTAPPDFTNSRLVHYSSAPAREAAEAAPIAVLEMFRPDGDALLPFDPRHLRQPGGMVRHAMMRWADETSGLSAFFGADLLARFIRGHKDAHSHQRSEGGHFAVVPLPSMNHELTADGWIRRVAIIGYGVKCREERELFDELSRGLHGRALEDNGRPVGEIRHLTGEPAGRALAYWRGTGTRWRSVTPVILTGRTRHGRTREDCLIRALIQQGFDAASIVSVATYAGPIVPKTFPARSYHVQGYLSTTDRIHAEVILDEAPTLPLIVGRGRFVGFGLFASVGS